MCFFGWSLATGLSITASSPLFVIFILYSHLFCYSIITRHFYHQYHHQYYQKAYFLFLLIITLVFKFLLEEIKWLNFMKDKKEKNLFIRLQVLNFVLQNKKQIFDSLWTELSDVKVFEVLFEYSIPETLPTCICCIFCLFVFYCR